MTFLVEIRYRELSYETRNGTRPEPYRARFRIAAWCEKDAMAMAIAEFRRIEIASSVGWTRDVVSIEVAILLNA